MGQRLSVLSLAENQNLVPSTYVLRLTTAYNSGFGVLGDPPSSGFWDMSCMQHTQVHTCTH